MNYSTRALHKQQLLDALYAPYKNCQSCPLAKQGRTQVVFGRGNPDSPIIFIGEGPGQEEDLKGLPFVGRAGKLLSKELDAIGIDEQQIFITNIVKCRPPQNRKPFPIESKTCKDLLLVHQMRIIQPAILCTLGASAVEGLLEQQVKITAMRGNLYKGYKYPILPTYHPAYVLRNPTAVDDFIKDIEYAYELSTQLPRII